MHPWLARREIVTFCESQNIAIEAYSPLSRGHKLQDPVVNKIAVKYSKSPAQILIRWSLQKGYIVLPKSSHKERIEQNSEVFDFDLADGDMDILDSLDEGYVSGKLLYLSHWFYLFLKSCHRLTHFPLLKFRLGSYRRTIGTIDIKNVPFSMEPLARRWYAIRKSSTVLFYSIDFNRKYTTMDSKWYVIETEPKWDSDGMRIQKEKDSKRDYRLQNIDAKVKSNDGLVLGSMWLKDW